MISTETSEARLTSARDAVSRHVAGPHLRYQEYAIALTSDHAADEFLGAVHFRRVDQRHPEPDEVRKELSATQSPLNSRRFSSLVSLPFTMRSLPLRRSCSVVKMVQPVVLLGGCVRPENLHRFKVATERRWRTRIAGVNRQALLR